ncbi:sensor histidine kinase [Sphingomonas koreensis]|nr:sensor histidine kinase [Sphingomonas koreensis]
MRLRSLSTRLSIAVIAVQAVGIAIAFACFPLLAPFTSYGLIADRTVRQLVSESIAVGHVIHPTDALRHYAQRRPTLRFAAADATGVLKGSDVRLAELLRVVAPRMRSPASAMQLTLGPNRGDRVFVTTVAATGGPIVLATTGNRFGSEDVASFWQAFLPAILPGYGPVLIAALIVVPLVLSRLLRPIMDAAERAWHLDIAKADRLLPIAGLPIEFEPLCAAIDAALAKARDGVIQQGLFFANAAHELRTPIAVMQLQLQQLSVGGRERDVLLGHARRMGLLVDQLLTVARLEHDATRMTTLDLVDLARRVAADCVPVALARGILIACEVPGTPVLVTVDRRSVEGAVMAIIDNATKVEPVGGEVIVKVDSDGALSVIDHGPGLVAEDRLHAFEPFWRKHDDGSGFGLGLAAVRRVTEIHGGSAMIEGDAGSGTRLTLRFPSQIGSSSG